ncbi:SDR family NAD(P)-dependent oxidoreductase [Thalassotalea fusca]
MNRKVLVTGGTRGIGAAVIEEYSRLGYEIYSTGSQQKTIDEAKNKDVVTKWYVCDFANLEQVDRLGQELAKESFDIVVHNVGIQQPRDLFKQDSEPYSFDQEIAINLTAPTLLCRYLLPSVEKQQGTMAFITSGLAVFPKQSSAIYCSAKSGLRTFVRCLRAQAKQQMKQVHICEVIMALVDTAMTEGRGKNKITPQQAAQELVKGINQRKDEIHVDKVKVLMFVRRLFPNFTESLLLKL